MTQAAIQTLVERTRSYLSIYDELGLSRYLRANVSLDTLIDLLKSPDANCVKVSATCLCVLTEKRAVPSLIDTLRHEDAVACSLAEYALWTTWFAEQGPHAESQLRRSAYAGFAEALELLDDLVDRYPLWAEPRNQRAMIHFKNRCFAASVESCEAVLELQPRHFGARAGLGHAHAQMGKYGDAADHYRKALQIHPHMEGVRQSLRTVRELIRKAHT